MRRWETVGEVRRYGDRFEWKVDASYFMPHNVDSYIGSPPFPYENSVWYFTKWPSGWAGPSVANWVGLSLCGTSSQCPVLYVKLGIKAADGTDLKSSKGKISSFGCFEEPRYLRTWQFMTRRSDIELNGCIIVFCKVRSEGEGELVATVMPMELPPREEENADDIRNDFNEADELPLSEEEEESDTAIVEMETPKSKSFDKLLRDLNDLLIEKDDTDVTIRVQDKEFRAHKNVLRVRCPVFHSMFQHGMVEQTTGVVAIDDCSPGLFPDFLNYIYTATVENLSKENVFGLYRLADKYSIEELKNECVEFIKKSLSVDTICEAIALSLQHFETQLMKMAVDFFCKNVNEIIVTNEWEMFLHENTAEGNKLFVKILCPEKLNEKDIAEDEC